MLLSLQKGVLYGPVNSRRYGRSLGINLMPTDEKWCSFNCVYCHYGLTRHCTLDMGKAAAKLPSTDTVVAALEDALRSSMELDLITFSGNGEPTLYPDFARLADAVVGLRDRYRPSADVALLSNATGLVKQDVRDAIAGIDLPVLKLDAGTARTFRAVNRPAKGISYEDIVELLTSLDDIYVQTVLVDGSPSNCGPEEIAGLLPHHLVRHRSEDELVEGDPHFRGELLGPAVHSVRQAHLDGLHCGVLSNLMNRPGVTGSTA